MSRSDMDTPLAGPPVQPPAPRRPRRRGRTVGLVVAPVLVVLLAIVAAVVFVQLRKEKATPGTPEAQAFLAAWTAGDTAKMQTLVSDANAPVAKDLAETVGALKPTGATYTFDGVQTPEGDSTDRVNAAFTAAMTVPGLGPWTYKGMIPLQVGTDDTVKVVWSRAVVHPDLATGQKLDDTRKWPDRATIFGANDQPLVQKAPSVTVAAVPQRIKDQAAMAKALSDNLGVAPSTVDRLLKQSWVKPDTQVPITSIRREVYDRVKPAIYDVPGLQFVPGAERLPPSPDFARHVLGRTGPITGDQLKQLGAPYLETDVVGQTGIEAAYEKTLAGTPSGDVHVVDAAGKPAKVLQTYTGTAPAPVHTTLEAAVQQGIETALVGVDKPAAFVAVDRDGHVRGAASRPLDEEFNRALLGQYPPGSTMKVVTSDALLSNGSTGTTPLSCPPTINVGGKVFRNFEGEAANQLTLTDAFRISCNTAFIGAAQKLTSDQLDAAADQFGFNADYNVGLVTKGGAIPPAADATEVAANAIGQGKVTASPLQMSTVAATVLGGRWQAPTLVTEPAPAAPAPPAVPLAPLDPAVQNQLNGMMHQVVISGTGVKAGVPGRDIAGKTGTAEFGNDNPPPTHAWFIGFDPTIAVAVIVEGGGTGGDVAAPLAGRFFAGR